MFGENKTRFFAGITWIICFIAIWLFFNATLPNNEFQIHLNKIEQSMAKDDWNNANKYMEQLKEIYDGKKVVIQMNNATEIYATFQLTMGQLDYAVKHKQISGVEYIGALNSSLDVVMKPFSGP